MTKQRFIQSAVKVTALSVLLFIGGYFASNYLLADPHNISLVRILFSAIIYAIFGFVVGWAVPRAWWLAIIVDWGLILFSFVALSYTLTHAFADITHSIFPPLLIALTLFVSRWEARLQLDA